MIESVKPLRSFYKKTRQFFWRVTFLMQFAAGLIPAAGTVRAGTDGLPHDKANQKTKQTGRR